MRGLTSRWELKLKGVDAGAEGALARGTGLPAALVRVLLARQEEGSPALDALAVKRITAPSMADLHDPSLLPGASRGAERLLGALRDGESIAVYGDYDVDGLTGTAILVRTLRTIDPGARILTYIPDRTSEGYGLHAAAVSALADRGARVIVTADCGITGAAGAREAGGRGVDLIVTDHHNPEGGRFELEGAYEVVHPRKDGGGYPCHELCGAGVAFKLAWLLATMDAGGPKVGDAMRQNLLDCMVLAAMGTVADVVPLVDENRILVRHGLNYAHRCGVVGVQALLGAFLKPGDRVTTSQVGWVLGPRLNACGRLTNAELPLELLLTEDAGRAGEIAEELSEVNAQRQRLTRQIQDEAEELLAAHRGDRVIVLAHEAWHRGVVGITCSRLVEAHRKPTILLEMKDGVCRGSGRSIEGYSLHEALTACGEELEAFGGHDMACGLSLSADRLDAFRERLAAHAAERITPPMVERVTTIDCEARLSELDLTMADRQELLGPFGQGYHEPTYLVRGLRLDGVSAMGAGGKHLRLDLRDERGAVVKGLWWNRGELAPDLPRGAGVDVAARAQINRWNGRESVQVEIADLAIRG